MAADELSGQSLAHHAASGIVLAWMVTRNRIPISSSPLKQPWSCVRHLVAPLLITWIYTASLAVAVLGVETPLRAWGFDLNNAQQRVATPEGAVQTMALRCADALLVPSDFPLKGYFPEWRNRAVATLIQTPDEAYQLRLMSSYGSNVISMTDSAALGTTTHLEPAAINRLAVCGAIGILGLETVFAFRALAGVGLKRSFWGSRQGFATVAGHVWSVRVAMVVLKAILVFAPMITVDYGSYLLRDLNWFGSPVQALALTLSRATAEAFFTVVEVIYLAQLYTALHVQPA